MLLHYAGVTVKVPLGNVGVVSALLGLYRWLSPPACATDTQAYYLPTYLRFVRASGSGASRLVQVYLFHSIPT